MRELADVEAVKSIPQLGAGYAGLSWKKVRVIVERVFANWQGRLIVCKELRVRLYYDIAYFFGGAFLVNAIPHFVSGVTGHPFQSPFATRPGEGLSPAWVNVLWGSANFAFAYVLLARVGKFEVRRWRHVLVAGAGGLAMGLMLSHAFARFYGTRWAERLRGPMKLAIVGAPRTKKTRTIPLQSAPGPITGGNGQFGDMTAATLKFQSAPGPMTGGNR